MINNDKKNLKIEYFVEYTNELERDPDFENIKQLPKVKDLEDAINHMLSLRKQGKHNIAIGYEIFDNSANKLVISDDVWNMEYLRTTTNEDKLQKEINKQNNLITELNRELELYQEFLTKYNAMDRFNKEMKGW
jgi:hypothetical protein